MKTVGPACTLGEGPLWHPQREELFWFDIPEGLLYSCEASGAGLKSWNFGEPASAAGWADADTLLVATASGLQKFDIASRAWETQVALEANNSATRSNDGRTGPDGSFWIGTMALRMTPRAGAYYRYKAGDLESLFTEVTIPNATCFSPDGKMAYLADTRRQLIWRWPLDGNGNPIGNKELHINLRDEQINPDGAVCDAEGYMWNAQWGASRVARYDPNGVLDRVIELPASQITCPAFGGHELKTLFVTSANEGLSDEMLAREPDAGKTFVLHLDVPGIPEHQVVL